VSLILRVRRFAPKLGRWVTLRLVGLAADMPNYLWEEEGVKVNVTRVKRLMGFDPTQMGRRTRVLPVAAGELPPEIRNIRFCRWCGRRDVRKWWRMLF